MNRHRELAQMMRAAAGPSVIVPDPYAWWKFDEGVSNVAYEMMQGGDFNGLLVKNPLWTAPLTGAGHSLTFNGTDQYVGGCGLNSDFNFIHDTGVFTLSCWVKMADVSSLASYIFMGSTLTSTEYGFWLSYENRQIDENYGVQNLRLDVNVGVSFDPVFQAFSSDFALTDTNTHHVAVSCDGDTARFYVDGVAFGSASRLRAFSTPRNATRPLNLARANYTSDVLLMNGVIDDVRVYSETLTQAQINAIAQAQA